MLELSLFSGAGGGLLASRLLGWRTIGYVENNDYCQRVLAARIRDGHIDDAAIFGDIRTFVSEGYAEQYRGLAGVVSAGFPCQPFSTAGKRLGADDPRNMWPATLDTIRAVRPRFAFLENVPGLLAESHGYFGTILADLAAAGYDARWTVLSAGDCGAPHLRKRLWIVAAAGGIRCDPRRSEQSPDLADTAIRLRCNVRRERSPGNAERDFTGEGPWTVEPDVGRVADGVASRVDRLKAIGNGQVPIVAATAWRLLTAERETP